MSKDTKKTEARQLFVIEIVVCINEKLARFGHFRIFRRYLSTNLTHLYGARRTHLERRALWAYDGQYSISVRYE